jgi:hypothetical protein
MSLRRVLPVLVLSGALHAAVLSAQPRTPAPTSTTVASLVARVKASAKCPELSGGMRAAYDATLRANDLKDSASLRTEFALVRVLFEATRDAGVWNLHWAVTDRQPTSVHVWKQWASLRSVDVITPTATAECDELSALFSFLARQAGVPSTGLLWPTYNHTVAVWSPAGSSRVRIVVPTTQIFLEPHDMFGTKAFDPWRQTRIHPYGAVDAAPDFKLPAFLSDFFITQIESYLGASDSTLQRLRYLRESVFLNLQNPAQAARSALGGVLGPPLPEDQAALSRFAAEMKAQQPRWPHSSGSNPACSGLRFAAVRQAKPGRGGRDVEDRPETSSRDPAGGKPVRPRVATSRKRVLRGAGSRGGEAGTNRSCEA